MSFSTYEEISAQIENEKSRKYIMPDFNGLEIKIHSEHCVDRTTAKLAKFGKIYGYQGTITGRMSCKQPNISNLPRTK